MKAEGAENQTYSLSLNENAGENNIGEYPSLTAGDVTALTVFNSGISLIGTISNILLILAVLTNQQLRQKHTAILLINLSFFDLLICAIYVPMNIYDINYADYGSGAFTETARNRMGFGLLIGSLNGELSVTLDSFVSICFPYWYVAYITKIRTSSIVSLSWFVAIVLTFLSLLTDTERYSFLYVAVILFLIISLHLAMYLVARRVAKIIALQYPTEGQKSPFWNKSAKTVAMVVTASLLCWAPIAILPAVVSPSFPSFKRYIKITLAFTSLSAYILVVALRLPLGLVHMPAQGLTYDLSKYKLIIAWLFFAAVRVRTRSGHCTVFFGKILHFTLIVFHFTQAMN